MNTFKSVILIVLLGMGGGFACPGDNLVYSLASVSDVSVEIIQSDPPQARVTVEGSLPSPCYHIPEDRIKVSREDRVFTITVYQAFDPDMICAQVLVEYRITVPLDLEGLPSGTWEVRVNDASVTFEIKGGN